MRAAERFGFTYEGTFRNGLQHGTGTYRLPELLWILCLCLLYWINRVWMMARRGEVDGALGHGELPGKLRHARVERHPVQP